MKAQLQIKNEGELTDHTQREVNSHELTHKRRAGGVIELSPFHRNDFEVKDGPI